MSFLTQLVQGLGSIAGGGCKGGSCGSAGSGNIFQQIMAALMGLGQTMKACAGGCSSCSGGSCASCSGGSCARACAGVMD